MKKISRRIAVQLFSLVGLALLLSALPSSSLVQIETDKLEFSIAVEKTGFVVGEPLKLGFRLRNTSDKDMTGGFNLSFDSGRLHVLISKNVEPFALYISKSLQIAQRKDRVIKPVTIKAGQTIESIEFVSFDVNTNGFAFPAQGRYKLRSTHFFDDGDYSRKLESNVVEISINEPAGIDQEALVFIRTNGLERFLTPEGRLFPHDVETIKKVQEFIERYPDSTYRPYAELALKALCRGRFDLPLCVKPSFVFEAPLEKGQFSKIEIPQEILQKVFAAGVRFQERPKQTREGGLQSDSLAEIGLQLDPNTGTISGTPSQAGEFLIWIEVLTADGRSVADIWVVLSIQEKQ